MEALKKNVVINCEEKTVTEINQMIRHAAKEGIGEVQLTNPNARHNLGVAITDPIHLVYKGDVGYYAASLCDNITAEIHGNAGWAVGENLIRGEVIVHGNASTACAPSLRGGTVVVKGSVGARSGIGLKGGTLIVGGDAGYMTGFMMQKGKIIICGNASRALGDSLYAGEIYVGGEIEELGNGTEIVEPSPEELEEITTLLTRYGIKAPKYFKKIQSNGSIHNFNKKQFSVWKEIL
jgi:glutamate synthase domain-containing protein 3